MSRFFIDRPNFAWVMAIFISLAGVLVLPGLPVEKYPEVAPPQISIYATYPGASAQVVNDTVTSIIEQELNGARDMLYYESSSANGSGELMVTFKPGTDPNIAQVDVQNRIRRAESRLPAAVTQLGLQVEQTTAGFLMLYSLTYRPEAPSTDVVRLNDYAARVVNNEIRRVPGVGRVQFFGADAAMRVWVDPQALSGYGLSIADVNSAIRAQNLQVAAGNLGERPFGQAQELTTPLVVRGMLESPEEFGQIVLRADPNGAMVRLADVAKLELGLENYQFDVQQNGGPAAGAAVQLAPGGNAVATVAAVRARLAELSHGFPADITYSVPFDSSTFVKVAIHKVLSTLLEAMVLVFLVMYLFLQNLRYTLIPAIVVPVCLLGTLAVMKLLGFSVNMMSMFAMVLAIGILVDDAIVVVENVERLMAEEGLSPREAAIKAMHQVGGAIVGITLVLAAVFLPLAFMDGSVGVIYRQFSAVLAVSILFSGLLALTMTPALCASLLAPAHGQPAKRGVFGWFDRRFAALTERFDALNGRLLRRAGRCMLIYLALLAGLAFAYLRLPEAFVPQEDEGYLMVDVQLPPGASDQRTRAAGDAVNRYFAGRRNMQDITLVYGFSFSGSGANAALAFPTLKDWSERDADASAASEVAAANAALAGISDATIMAVLPPPVEGLGNSGGFALRIQDRGNLGREQLMAAVEQVLARASHSPRLAYAMIEGLADAPQLRLQIDRGKAEALGVSFQGAMDVLSSAFGSAMVNDFVNQGRLQRVVVQGDARYRATPEALDSLYVGNRNGQQVPFSAFTHLVWEQGPVQIARYNGYAAVKITGEAAQGTSSGEALAEMERLLDDLPAGIGYEWTALSYQEAAAGTQAPLLLGFSLLIVFLLLVALYESWAIPLSVMLIVPIGAIGATAAVWVAGLANDVYFKVGLITIIGLAAKNAILIVAFAKELHADGHDARAAALMAARLRFRPIVMTSLAFILGVVPLVLARGAGAASQNAIGTGVIGGMLAASSLGVLFTPIFFAWVMARRRSARHAAST
ncbi:multidrug efflux RND transporter permease subunit [Xanthomonas maliensis]|uniref:multidrug efflux RND transporter permease subunit n=1 Tax=Xanthomonas maliensis TaxID=1321368 RepID=UPI00039FF4E2|nr:multidrug efflux RND transporter permease subunit [Xanthomonas maliensis]KAB7771798.1 multidrug efflux RND transporter permease subunit [Xanthomonas maliensis]